MTSALSRQSLCTATVLGIRGEFLAPFDNTSPVDRLDYASRLRIAFECINPCLRGSRPHNNAFISTDLPHCTHVFVRYDAIRKPLQPPCGGSHHILQRNSKHVTLKIKDRHNVTSLNHDNPAYLDNVLVSEAFHPHTSISPPSPAWFRRVSFKDPVTSFNFFKQLVVLGPSLGGTICSIPIATGIDTPIFWA